MENEDPAAKSPFSSYTPIDTGWRRNEERSDEETERAGRVLLVLTGVVITLLALFRPADVPPGSLHTIKPPEQMTAQQAAAALSGIGRDESCIHGATANGQNLYVKKVSPMARELYEKGRFRVAGLSSPPSGDQFFNDPQQAIEVMAHRGVTEFRSCPLSRR
jgi:hypothetical protein